MPAALVLLGIGFLASISLGLSGLYAEVAQAEMDRWPALKRRPPMAEVDRVAGLFSRSLEFAGGNPWAQEGLGAASLEKVRISLSRNDALRFAREAHSHYARALRERPASPYLWANLALAKLYLDQADAEFRFALRSADELGPWEPGVQRVVLVAGLAAWDRLDDGGRRLIEALLERAALRNARSMFEIVKTYQRLDLACRIKGYDAVAGADCAQPKAPPGPVPSPRAKR